MSILKVWQLTLILAKQDPVEGGHIEKRLFTLFWWENMISDLSIDFQMVTNGGFKKASLYVYFEGLTTDSYFGKARPLGERSYRKRLLYTLLMRKHDFWPFHWLLNGQKWGV